MKIGNKNNKNKQIYDNNKNENNGDDNNKIKIIITIIKKVLIAETMIIVTMEVLVTIVIIITVTMITYRRNSMKQKKSLKQEIGQVNTLRNTFNVSHKYYTEMLKTNSERKIIKNNGTLICNVNQSNECYVTVIQDYIEIMSQHRVR